VAPLSQNTLDSVVQSALSDLTASGVDPLLVAKLAGATYQVANLPGADLGLTYQSADTVQISGTAAGFGWYTGTAPGSSPAGSGRMDLLTTVLHEMGHLAGLPDTTSSDGLMAEYLSPGVRHTDALDQVFAGL
jgi:hypothetical protein